MKNKLMDLNNHLFAQLERLSDEGLTSDELEQEAERSKAIVAVSDRIATTADLQLKAAKMIAEHGAYVKPHLPLIGEAKE